VPALLKKLPLFIFGGSFKSAALSGVGKCNYRHFFKVPAIVIPVEDLKRRLLHLRQFAKMPANLFKGSLPKCQLICSKAVCQNARKIFFRLFAKKPANLFKGSLPKCQENLFQAVRQKARKIFFRQFGKMPGKSFWGSLAKCQENHF
jgi:hypothetical protein